MVTLEQVKLLETKVTKALEFVSKVTGENTLLKEKLDTYQRRIDELEVLIQRFKEDQSRIEEGIISALNRLNQFEDAIEKSLSPLQNGAGKTEGGGGNPENDFLDSVAEPDTGHPSEPLTDEPRLAEPGQGLFEPETEDLDPSGAEETIVADPLTNTAELDIF
ncbi:MAG: cell division protein ZapB [Spirochaetaceae bacterium]|jgi:hypothetical protein|nr:cell division protein ZapB [Spirochaetaceae bacterium]